MVTEPGLSVAKRPWELWFVAAVAALYGVGVLFSAFPFLGDDDAPFDPLTPHRRGPWLLGDSPSSWLSDFGKWIPFAVGLAVGGTAIYGVVALLRGKPSGRWAITAVILVSWIEADNYFHGTRRQDWGVVLTLVALVVLWLPRPSRYLHGKDWSWRSQASELLLTLGPMAVAGSIYFVWQFKTDYWEDLRRMDQATALWLAGLGFVSCLGGAILWWKQRHRPLELNVQPQ